ncbi:MAG: DUF6788 family protein [Chloroflexota bacterium]
MLDNQIGLAELEAQRTQLYAELAATDDFRRGSVTANYRRCGRPNCVCARPGHPGHGPRYLWTRSVAGGKTKGRQLAGLELEKVRQELSTYQQFVAVTERIVEVNEAICEARPGSRLADGAPPLGGSTRRSRRRSPRK